jgi:hypothetical protein
VVEIPVQSHCRTYSAGRFWSLSRGDKATYYLDRELVLEMANVIPDFNTGYDILDILHPERWSSHQDGPVILGFHDRDIALDHHFMDRLFAALPTDYQTLGINQYVGSIDYFAGDVGSSLLQSEELGITEITKRATGYSMQQLASFSEHLLQAAKDIQALNGSTMPGALWKLIRVLGGGELLEKTLAPVLPSGQLDFEFTRLPVVLAAYAVFLKGQPHPTGGLISERNLGRKFFLAEFAVYIETILGHANWNAIAAMKRQSIFALGKPEGVSRDTESLRSAVEAFHAQNPRVYADIKNGLKQRWVLAVATRQERIRRATEA